MCVRAHTPPNSQPFDSSPAYTYVSYPHNIATNSSNDMCMEHGMLRERDARYTNVRTIPKWRPYSVRSLFQYFWPSPIVCRTFRSLAIVLSQLLCSDTRMRKCCVRVCVSVYHCHAFAECVERQPTDCPCALLYVCVPLCVSLPSCVDQFAPSFGVARSMCNENL